MNAFMPNFDLDRDTQLSPPKWEGLTEIDQAIRENRLMEYRIKKSWADPWGRKLSVLGIVVIVGVFSFLAGTSFGLW